MTTTHTDRARYFRVIVRTWANGRLLDERLIAHAESFEAATAIARRHTGDRVRLNNDDITVSIEPNDAPPHQPNQPATAG